MIIRSILFFCAALAFGSDLPGGYTANAYYGQSQYLKMSSLKEFEQFMENAYHDIDIPVKIVQSFPATPVLRFQLLKPYSKFTLGLFYSQSATGGRMHYADYSADVTVDYTLANRHYGLVFQSPNLGGERFRIVQSTQLGLMMSSFEVYEAAEIWDLPETERTSLETLAYCIEPGIDAELRLFNRVSIGAYTGLNLVVYTDAYHLEGNKDAKLMLSSSKSVKPDWMAFNMALKIGFTFNTKPSIASNTP